MKEIQVQTHVIKKKCTISIFICEEQQPLAAAAARTCSCSKAVRENQTCTLGWQFPKENIIYQVVSGKVETYVGLASTTWKARLAGDKSSMENKLKPQAESYNSPEARKHTWDLKDKRIDFKIDWKFLDRAPPPH